MKTASYISPSFNISAQTHSNKWLTFDDGKINFEILPRRSIMSVIKQLSAKLAQSENERHSHLGKAQSSPPAIQETKVVLLSGKKCKQGPVYSVCHFS